MKGKEIFSNMKYITLIFVFILLTCGIGLCEESSVISANKGQLNILIGEAGRDEPLPCRIRIYKPDNKIPLIHNVCEGQFEIPVETIVVAIGQKPNPLIYKSAPDLKTSPKGTICVDENFMTSVPGVFAGGDIATGAATVISAMGAGKKAARAIDKYIKN